MLTLSPVSAKHAVAALKRGVFSSTAIEDLTEGRDHEISAVRKALANASEGGSSGTFFEADYGFGKSHMLGLVTAIALREGFAVSWIVFDHKSQAFNHPARYLHVLLQHLRFPEVDSRGLAHAVHAALGDDRRAQLMEFAATAPSFIRNAVFQLSFGDITLEARDAAFRLLECRDLQAKNGIKHYDEVLSRLQALPQLVKVLGFKGIAWLFDELECLTNLTNSQSRFAGYSLLHQLLQSARLPYSWFFFTTTGDFRERLHGEKSPYARYEGAPQFVRNWREGALAVHALKKLKPDQKLRLLHSVRQVHGIAFAWQPHERVTDDFLVRFLEQTQKAGLTEREMLKSMVTILEVCEQHQQCNPMRELFSAEQKTAIIQNVA